MLIPHFVELLIVMVVLSLTAGVMVFLTPSRAWSVVRWIDHTCFVKRFMSRACVYWAAVLPPFCLNYVVTTGALSLAGVPAARHNPYAIAIQLWLLLLPLLIAAW